MVLNEITKKIVQSALEVHRGLGGPGLLESVYEEALVWELKHQGLKVLRQVQLPVHYKGLQPGTILRIHLLVEAQIIVECKSCTHQDKIFESQLLTYLRVSGLKIGLLLNFGQPLMKNGIHRSKRSLNLCVSAPLR